MDTFRAAQPAAAEKDARAQQQPALSARGAVMQWRGTIDSGLP